MMTMLEIPSLFAGLPEGVCPGMVAGKQQSAFDADFPTHGIAWPDDPQPVPFVGAKLMVDTLINSA